MNLTIYSEKPWAILRLLSVKYSIQVARFRNQADAALYLRIFRRHKPQARFQIVFDPFNTRRPT